MTPPATRHLPALALALAAWALCIACSSSALAAQAQAAPRLELTVGKSVVVKTQADITRVSVADPSVADFVLLSPRQVYIAGKGSGVTNVTMWDATEQVRALYDIEVQPDVGRLRRLVSEVMPDETGVEIRPANSNVAISGQVKSEANLKRLVSLAEAMAPGKVLNLVQVGGVHQVMLEVRVAEMSRTLMKELGFNLNLISEGNFLYTFLGGLTSVPMLSNVINPYTTKTTYNNGSTTVDVTNVDSYNKVNHPSRFYTDKSPLNINSATQGMFNLNTNINGHPATWTGFIDALKDNGLIKILAEPTLVCLNGQTAQFLAGGEMPVPIPQALGSVTIEWKKFGVELQFTPNVLSGDRISLQVAPSVSELDFSKSIQIGSYAIPTINKRSTSTVIELGDGQSFAIAGLLNESTRDSASKFPGIGDVPVLGSLFKSSKYQQSQTELLIIITPRLAKPMDPKALKLPTDGGIREPDDLEFYLGIDRNKVGLSAPAAPQQPQAQQPQVQKTSRSLDGDFGHALPAPPASGGQRPVTSSDLAK